MTFVESNTVEPMILEQHISFENFARIAALQCVTRIGA
jgi:hypothetical protein